jgi:hypothetical protein
MLQHPGQREYSIANWVGMPYTQLNGFIRALAVYQFKVNRRAQMSKEKKKRDEEAEKLVLPKVPGFYVLCYEDITGFTDGVDVRTGERPRGHGYKARWINDWSMNVTRARVEAGEEKHEVDSAMTGLHPCSREVSSVDIPCRMQCFVAATQPPGFFLQPRKVQRKIG